jgi:hypothetical protein
LFQAAAFNHLFSMMIVVFQRYKIAKLLSKLRALVLFQKQRLRFRVIIAWVGYQVNQSHVIR